MKTLNKQIYGGYLIQLLLNSLTQHDSRHEEYRLNFLNDNLYFIPAVSEDDKEKFTAYKISMFYNNLSISVQTFTKISFKKSESLYNSGKVFMFFAHDKKLHSKRKKGEGKEKRATFFFKGHLKQDHNKKNQKRSTREFVNFNSLSEFNRSKVGCVLRVLKESNEKLDRYLHLKPLERDISDQRMKNQTKRLYSKGFLKERLRNGSVFVIDSTEDKPAARKMIASLKEIAYDAFGVKVEVSEDLRPGHYNIQLIHNQANSKKQKEDRYKPWSDDLLIQNITVEDYDSPTKAKVATVLKELVIKDDIRKGCISLIDTEDLQRLAGYIFFLPIRDETKNGSVSIITELVKMEIGRNGKINFEKVDIRENSSGDPLIERIVAFVVPESSKFIECLIVDPELNINQIKRTDILTLPDYDYLYHKLKEVEKPLPGFAKSYGQLADVLRVVLREQDDTIKDPKKWREFISYLEETPEIVVTKNRFRKMMNGFINPRTDDAKLIRDYLYERFGILFNISKKRERIEDYLASNIGVYKIDEEAGDSFYYYVGTYRQNVQKKIQNATHLRKVSSSGDSTLFVDKLFFMMDVDFVKTGERTVVPFAMKYLREYAEREKNDAS